MIKEDCFAYSEDRRVEYLPSTGRKVYVKHHECRILRRIYCTFEDCTFYKTQRFLDEERRRCSLRLKRLREEGKYGGKQQTEGKAV